MGSKGAAWEKYCNDNANQYRQSSALLDAALNAIAVHAQENGCKYVLLPGDLTKDGEYEGHVEMATRLEQFELETGIQVIVTALRQALDMGVARQGIAPPETDPSNDQRVIPSYTISAPRSASVSFNNKANRVLQDVNFTARLAGAIHTVEIKGALTYAL